MGGRDIHSPLGIPKSPSFHSGLDLVASVGAEESLKKAYDQHETTGFPGKFSFYSNFGPAGSFVGTGAPSPTAVGTPGVTFGGSAAAFGGNSVGRFGDSSEVTFGGLSGSSVGNAATMINGKSNLDIINGGVGPGTIKNGIGLSTQVLAFQKNSTAVRSMQAMGHLSLLKGTNTIGY